MNYLKRYLKNTAEHLQTSQAIAFMASLDAIEKTCPEIAQAILQELFDQKKNLKMIASENYSSLNVQLAMGNLLTDKYSEGSVKKRYYSGCENIDTIEHQAVLLAKKLYGAEHAYVQPHSGADANLIAFLAILTVRVQDPHLQYLGKKLDALSKEEYTSLRNLLAEQKMMGMSLSSGGHLTHGYRHNISSKLLSCSFYEVNEQGYLDYESIQSQVMEEKPLILVAGYSSYTRKIDFAKMRSIADQVKAVLLVDMAHFSGLVAGKAFTGNYNPVGFADVITSTTHKTLRGPRGGLILCTEEFKAAVDRGCPLVIGGPLPHVMAAKAVAFKEALDPSFRVYTQQIIRNAKALAEAFLEEKVAVLTQGTDNHMVLIDVQKTYGITGKAAEQALRSIGVNVNRNAIPGDKNGPWWTSGIRLGTPALTTIGMKEEQMRKIAKWIHTLLQSCKPVVSEGKLSKAEVKVDPKVVKLHQKEIEQLLQAFPVYPELSFDEEFCKTM